MQELGWLASMARNPGCRRRTARSTGGRALWTLLGWLALIALGAVLALSVRWAPRAMLQAQVDVKVALKALRSEELAFLVTGRVVTQVVVERRENSLLLGKGESFMLGVVRFHFGVDLASLPADAVKREGDMLVVTLPDPSELGFSVDLRSVKCYTKRSGLLAIRDWVTGSDTGRELRQAFHEAARKFVRKEGLAPTREGLVRRLNRYAPALRARLRVAVGFR